LSRYDKKSLKQLHKISWKWFSKYIRKKNDGKCFTCGNKLDWKQTHAGHFVHSGNSINWLLDFDERNVNCQCVRCNNYLSGNLSMYASRLIGKYGCDVIDELNDLKFKKVEIARTEAVDMILKYQKKFKKLK
jgi:hypothetical protein